MWLDVLGIVLPVLATIVAAVIAKRSASKELKLKFEHLQKQWNTSANSPLNSLLGDGRRSLQNRKTRRNGITASKPFHK